MKIWACLSWFDESPRWLAATVASLAQIADHVIAVDGAYFRYPNGRPSSGGEQAETIQATATAVGLGCTLHTPAQVWMGDEIEKRNMTLRLVETLGTAFEDWLLVIDGDEQVSYCSGLTRSDLVGAEQHAAEVTFHATAGNPHDSNVGRTRRFYRLLPGMEYTTSHYTIEAGGVRLNGRGAEFGEAYVDAFDLTSQVRIEHKHSLRDVQRTAAAEGFALERHHTEPWPQR